MPHKVSVFRIEMRAPDDLSQLQLLVAAGALRPHAIVAIICKTEGNGRMNDFTIDRYKPQKPSASSPVLPRPRQTPPAACAVGVTSC